MDVRQRILESLQRTEGFLCALATSDEHGQPRVRYMIGLMDDDLVIRLPTFNETNKIQHILNRPDVCLACGDTDSRVPGSYFHIEGQAVVSRDVRDRRLTWTVRLEKWFSGPEDPDYAVVKINPTKIVAMPIGGGEAAQVWTRGKPNV